MKLIILAAGRGTRLGTLTANTPKALLSFSDGSTILEKQIENAIDANFDSIYIVAGFRAEQVEAKIKYWQKQIPIYTARSHAFETTNSLASACLVNWNMTEDFMITDGDNVYQHGLLRDIFRESDDKGDGINIVVSPKSVYDNEDMGVEIDGDNVIRMSKQVPLVQVDANCVGLAVVTGEENRRLFADKLDELVTDQANDYWEEVLNSLISNGVHVGHISIDDNDWIEVDTVEDYDKAEITFSRAGSRELKNRSADIRSNQPV